MFYPLKQGMQTSRPLGLLGGAVIRKTSYSEGLKDSSLIGFNPLMVLRALTVVQWDKTPLDLNE
jgi:hypothetical protein